MKAALFCLLALCACAGNEKTVELKPVDITRQHACALDGMTVIDHHGPKAQLLRRDQSRAVFCDAKEAFPELLDPVRRRQVAQIWFQPLDQAPWESHPGDWAPAADLLFVAGSGKLGSMGPTLAPFKNRAKAKAFVAQYGGQIHRYEQIDQAVLEALKQQGMDELSRAGG